MPIEISAGCFFVFQSFLAILRLILDYRFLPWTHKVPIQKAQLVFDSRFHIARCDRTQVIVKGANKEEVGELAANIRGTRPPEPYKGKGIRYVGEYVRRKEGKTGK